jgi:hypothetical protein
LHLCVRGKNKANLQKGLFCFPNFAELFEDLLRSYPERRDVILNANGGNTDY